MTAGLAVHTYLSFVESDDGLRCGYLACGVDVQVRGGRSSVLTREQRPVPDGRVHCGDVQSDRGSGVADQAGSFDVLPDLGEVEFSLLALGKWRAVDSGIQNSYLLRDEASGG